MFSKFLLTGATGFLGNTIARMLNEKGFSCKALVMSGDEYISKLPAGIEKYYGDLSKPESLNGFFDGDLRDVCVIHCAGIISIATKNDDKIFKVNVEGTRNMLRLALNHKVGRFVYVSSVHALPEKPKGEEITETKSFDPNVVRGDYAKSKAIATDLALKAAKQGLNISVVHPSGIIGPLDWRHGEITTTIMTYCRGDLPAGVRGRNNFVDVRDVAEGILSCVEKGKMGECYILSGHVATIREILECVRPLIGGKKLLYMPLFLMKMFAPIYERHAAKKNKKTFFTPYAAYTLGSNSDYSNKKARRELGYKPRSLRQTIKDALRWLKKSGQLKTKTAAAN